MDALLEVISPLGRGRRYGALSASFLLVLVLAEIEGLAFLVFALAVGNAGLFLTAQGGLFPAALFVSAATAGSVLWRASRWEFRRRSVVLEEAELVASFTGSDWQRRIGITSRS